MSFIFRHKKHRWTFPRVQCHIGRRRKRNRKLSRGRRRGGRGRMLLDRSVCAPFYNVTATQPNRNETSSQLRERIANKTRLFFQTPFTNSNEIDLRIRKYKFIKNIQKRNNKTSSQFDIILKNHSVGTTISGQKQHAKKIAKSLFKSAQATGY